MSELSWARVLHFDDIQHGGCRKGKEFFWRMTLGQRVRKKEEMRCDHDREWENENKEKEKVGVNLWVDNLTRKKEISLNKMRFDLKTSQAEKV